MIVLTVFVILVSAQQSVARLSLANLLLNNNNNNNNNNQQSPLNGLNNRIRDQFMNGVLQGRNSPCTGQVNGQNRDGTCLPRQECTRRGGTVGSTCGLVGVCCFLSSRCGNTVTDRISYWLSSAEDTIPDMCALTVRLYTPNVCQIRLDFEDFIVASPDSTNAPPIACVDSFAVVAGTTRPFIGFNALCGNLTGQHIYLHVNSSVSNQVMLQINTGQDKTNVRWQIKIHQLECWGLEKNLTTVQSALTSVYQRHQNKKVNLQNDRDLIAPPNCLQYFPDAAGTYESFNYLNNGAEDTEVPNVFYDICFNTRFGCTVSHTFQTLDMAVLNVGDPAKDSCRGNTDNDWLHIPISNPTVPGTLGVDGDYYCTLGSLPAATGTVTSNQPGPHHVTVRIDNTGGGTPSRFRADYLVNDASCQPPA